MFRAISLDSITVEIRMSNINENKDEMVVEEFELVDTSTRSGACIVSSTDSFETTSIVTRQVGTARRLRRQLGTRLITGLPRESGPIRMAAGVMRQV